MNPKKPFVAVVDDEAPVRRALERLLRSSGIDTRAFATGGAMLEDLARREPDCVILDLHMPGMSGFDVQDRLSEREIRIPVIVMTGHDTPESCGRAKSGGAAAYLRKPIDGEELLAAVGAAIRGGPIST